MKKWTKILCCALLVGLFSVCTLAGCATVGNITNNNKELIYNGNSAVMVGDHLYYGNAFADISNFSSDGDYKSSAKSSFLARVDTNNLNAKDKDYSPKNVENVSEEVTGYANSFMFVLGNQIYYATPNRQKVSNDNNITNEYEYTCIYRSKLNGDGKKKLYTTTAKIDQIEALKVDGTYYIVLLAGQKLVKINLSNNKSELIAEGVTSVAMPKTYQKDKIGSTLDWNGFVYYTKVPELESGSGRTGSEVWCAKLSDSKSNLSIYYEGSTVELKDRDKDVVFFTEKKGSFETETYMKDFASSATDFRNDRELLQTSSNLSNFVAIDVMQTTAEGGNRTETLGYIYSVGSNLGFTILGGKSDTIQLKNGAADFSSYKTLFVNGTMLYMSTTTGIFSAELSTVFRSAGQNTEVQVQNIVTMTAIYDGDRYAFDGKNIYFYAQLETVDIDEDGETEDEKTSDVYHLYRTNVGKTGDYQLLGKPSITERRS